MNKIILLIMLLSSFVFGQQTEKVVVVGDRLIGKTINGQNIREVIGNVVITQGDVVITCSKAIQYLVKNEFELIGNVVATQDSIIIKTERGYYYGDSRIARSDTNVNLSEPSFNLNAKRGRYYYNQDLAHFTGDVVLVDSSFILTSHELFYFSGEEKIIAKTNVQVIDTSSIIFADSLRHYRNENISYAFGNVRVDNFANDLIIYGDSLYNDNNKQYSRVTGSPLFMQIDTSSLVKIDTLLLSSKVMESFNDSTKKFIATDSVKIVRGDFASLNDMSILYNGGERIETHKLNYDSNRPIIWNEETQLVGDSIFIHLKERDLDWIDVRGNSVIVSKKEDYDWRYDQISGERINMFFVDGNIIRTEVYNSVLSIYYMFEEGEPSGLIKSSSQTAKIFFEEGQVVDVRLFQSVISEYHPENLVIGKEREFTLPQFIIYGNRPLKQELLKRIRK